MGRRLVFAFALGGAILAATPGLAQRNIGAAVTVSRDVSGLLEGRDRRLSAGDTVFAEETIRTAAESAASLRFLDATTLAVGPSASVRLDRFVYNPDATARSAVLSVGRGAFRWTSGQSNPRAYEVRTPKAVIGVRGTSFDLVVEDAREVLVLREGVVRVCLVGTSRCLALATPGQAVVITRGALTPRSRAEAPQRFAQRCLSGAPACTVDAPFEAVVVAPAPRGNWDGWHVGVHVDGVRGTGGPRYDGSPSVRTSIGLGNVPGRASFDDSFLRMGFGTGYTVRQGMLVYGIDADLTFLGGTMRSFEQRTFGALTPVTVTTETRARLDMLATLRPRLGTLLREDLLVYVTAGLALGSLDIAGSITNTTGGGGIYEGRRRTLTPGWVAGLGLEHVFGAGFSIRAELLHYELGSATARLAETTGFVAPGDPAPFASSRVRAGGDLMRFSLTRRF